MAATGVGYNAPYQPGYNAPSGPGYNAPSGPGYNKPQGPGYSSPAGAPPAAPASGWGTTALTPPPRAPAGAPPNADGGHWQTPAKWHAGNPWAKSAQNAIPAQGTQSGPGLLEQWFNQRANGSDPGYEYAMGRGTAELNRQSAARGGFNSSASMRSLSDMYSNMGAQREGQLDQLAAGASGEHQGRLDAMFGQGLGIANGQAGAALPYAMGAGGAQNTAAQDAYQAKLIAIGVDPAVAAQRAKDEVGALSFGLQAYNIGSKAGGGGGSAPPAPGTSYGFGSYG